MREAAERRQQLELEHEQALAILNAKQQEIDLLQKVSWGWGWGPGRRQAVCWGPGVWVAGCSPEPFLTRSGMTSWCGKIPRVL